MGKGNNFASVCPSIHIGVPTLSGGTYPSFWGPTLARDYFTWLGLPTMPWNMYPRKGVPTLVGKSLPWPGGTYLG